MGDLHSSVNESHLIDGLDFWGKSSVDTENFSFNNSSNSEIVENFCAVFPWVGITILSNGLIVETIDGGDLSSLVISSQESDVGWVLKLQAEEKLEGLNWIEASVDEISHKNVSSVWDLSSLVEEFEEIMELSMDISADSYWSLNWLNVTLFDENLLDLLAKDSELSLWENCSVFDGL